MFDFLIDHRAWLTQPYFTLEPLYKIWVKDKHPECNIFDYLKFKEEIEHATRLEF